MKKVFIIFFGLSLLIPSVCAQDITLRYNLQKGLVFQSESNMHTTMVQKVMGINQEIQMDMYMKLHATVSSVSQDLYAIEYRYQRLKITTTSTMFAVSIDTEGPDTPQNDMMRLLIGKPFTVYMDDRGRIKNIAGLDEIIDGVDSMNIDDETRQQYKASLEETFGEDNFIQNFQQSSLFYPEKPVKPDQSWRYNFSTTSSNVSLNLQNNATLKNLNSKTALVRITSLIDTPPNDSIVIGGNKGNITMTGHQISEARIDRATGIVLESTVSQDIKGKLTLSGVPGSDEAVEVPMSMSSKINVTRTIDQ